MDVMIRNVTVDQKRVMEKEAKNQGTTVSGLVKYWAQRLLEKETTEGPKR